MIERISTVILTFHVAEDSDDVLVRFNNWMTDRYFPPLKDMTSDIGGFRRPNALTYGTIGNWFKETNFVETFDAYDWLFPENAVLIVHTDNKPSRVYRPPGS